MFNTVVMKGESEDSDVDVVAPEQAPTARTRQRKKTGIPAVLQRPNLVSPQLKMTPTQQAAYTRGLIEESGGDASKASTSYAAADRARRQVLEAINNECHEQWTPPRLCTMHWDSKLTSSLSDLLGVPAYLLEG